MAAITLTCSVSCVLAGSILAMQAAQPASSKLTFDGERAIVIRVAQPMPDGNILYVHVIDPVVSGADYGLLSVLSELYPKEATAIVELYRGAFVASLSTIVGNGVKHAGVVATPR